MKTVLITGGSRGIGKAMVEAFCKQGCRVAFTYCNSETQALELQNKTGAVAIKCDSRNESDISVAVKTLGRVDVLINNAGISQNGLITDLSLELWNEIFTVNVTGAFLFSRAVLPDMIRRHEGCIINIASMWGETGASCEVAYSASKAAIIGFTKALAKEVGLSGIRVNCISPGVIMTDMLNEYSQEDLDALKEETPLSRLGTPEDIANAAVFLASESSGFITGQILSVNGGFVI